MILPILDYFSYYHIFSMILCTFGGWGRLLELDNYLTWKVIILTDII